MSKLDLTKPVQTRNGRPVRILCTDAQVYYASGRQTVVGLITENAGQGVGCWHEDGRFFDSGDSDKDLINVPTKRRVTGWMNVYPDSDGPQVHRSKRLADANALSNRIACIPIDIEFTEGDGLDGAQ